MKLNILVCGSKNFNNEEVVFNTLSTFYEQTNGNIGTIVTSKFSGACEFAESWVKSMNEELEDSKKINLQYFILDEHLIKRDLSIYEDIEIPQPVLESDPYFIKGKEIMMGLNIQLVLAFPNEHGVLGTATCNIQRFAALSGAPVFDCSKLMCQLHELEETEKTSIETEPQAPSFNNLNIGKNRI